MDAETKSDIFTKLSVRKQKKSDSRKGEKQKTKAKEETRRGIYKHKIEYKHKQICGKKNEHTADEWWAQNAAGCAC